MRGQLDHRVIANASLSFIALARAAIGIAQGIALYLLFTAVEAKAWPATAGQVFAPLLFVALFVPLIVVTALGNLRVGALVIWTVLATALCAGLAFYDIHGDPVSSGFVGFGLTGAGEPRLLPSLSLWLALAAGLFILQSLVISAAADGRFVAGYARHFDVSWKHGVQIVLAMIFAAIFWALLWLGAALFGLIQLRFGHDLIKQAWFSIPVTALTFACALHVTDASAGLVRGTRTLKLTLLSWLLPMMTLIVVAFLLALLFTGLEPLWTTRRATSILLISAAVLVLLVNAAYQDGLPEPTVTPIMRYARLIAAVLLVPLLALATYGLYLRVQQYGWTPQRISLAACIAVLGCYAVGYAIAVIISGSALRGLQTTNVATAYVMLATLLALFTPIADPARISVIDQISRLNAGRTSPDNFDYRFLRFDAGNFGRAALGDLAKRSDGPQAAAIAQKASDAMAMTNRYSAAAPFVATAQSRVANIAVMHPAGQKLPESFTQQDWSGHTRRFFLPTCLSSNAKCDAYFIDLDGDGTPEILLFGVTGQSVAFKSDQDGSWSPIGSIMNSHCPGVQDALRAGKFEIIQPVLKEIEVEGQRLRVNAPCAQQGMRGASIKAVIAPQ